MDTPPSQPPRPPSPQPPEPSRRFGVHFSASSFIQAPSPRVEYSGILHTDPGGGTQQAGAGTGEVSIQIVGSGEAGAASERADEVIVEEQEEGHGTRAQPAEPAPAASGGAGGSESSSYQRYDIQQVARFLIGRLKNMYCITGVGIGIKDVF